MNSELFSTICICCILAGTVKAQAPASNSPVPNDVRLRTPIKVLNPHTGPGGINVEVERSGFIDGDGKLIIPPQWEDVHEFHEGLAKIKLNGKSGFIDPSGTVVIEPQWDNWDDLNPVDDFSEGLAAVERGEKWGYVDRTGKIVIPLQWDKASGFHEGLAAVKQNDKWGFIDPHGKVVVPPTYAWARSFHEGVASVEKTLRGPLYKNLDGFIDHEGHYFSYADWDLVGDISDGLIRVVNDTSTDSTTGFMDKEGKIVLRTHYHNVGDFHEGLADVQPQKDGLCGYMDKQGKLVIPPQWPTAHPFSCGRAVIWNETLNAGVIDQSGHVVVEPHWLGTWGFSDGLCEISERGEHRVGHGIIDTDGKVVVAPVWDEAKIHDGYVLASGNAVKGLVILQRKE